MHDSQQPLTTIVKRKIILPRIGRRGRADQPAKHPHHFPRSQVPRIGMHYQSSLPSDGLPGFSITNTNRPSTKVRPSLAITGLHTATFFRRKLRFRTEPQLNTARPGIQTRRQTNIIDRKSMPINMMPSSTDRSDTNQQHHHRNYRSRRRRQFSAKSSTTPSQQANHRNGQRNSFRWCPKIVHQNASNNGQQRHQHRATTIQRNRRRTFKRIDYHRQITRLNALTITVTRRDRQLAFASQLGVSRLKRRVIHSRNQPITKKRLSNKASYVQSSLWGWHPRRN